MKKVKWILAVFLAVFLVWVVRVLTSYQLWWYAADVVAIFSLLIGYGGETWMSHNGEKHGHGSTKDKIFKTCLCFGVVMEAVLLCHKIPEAIRLNREIGSLKKEAAELVATNLATQLEIEELTKTNLVLRSNVVTLESDLEKTKQQTPAKMLISGVMAYGSIMLGTNTVLPNGNWSGPSVLNEWSGFLTFDGAGESLWMETDGAAYWGGPTVSLTFKLQPGFERMSRFFHSKTAGDFLKDLQSVTFRPWHLRDMKIEGGDLTLVLNGAVQTNFQILPTEYFFLRTNANGQAITSGPIKGLVTDKPTIREK